MSAQIIPLRTGWPRPPLKHRSTARSLSDQDCFGIAAALQLLPGLWQAQRDEHPDGTIVMSLFTHEEEMLPVFVISRDGEELQLHGGAPSSTIGYYGNVFELMRAAHRTLER